MGDESDAPGFLRNARQSQAVFYPVLQAGRVSATPTDSPAGRIDPNVAGSEFGGVGSIEVVHPFLGTFMCTGTVISPTHVLTAGHCFDVEADGQPDDGITGTFNLNDGGDFSSTHTVSNIHIHPDFFGFANGGNDDLSILELATPVPASTTLYTIRIDEMAVGEALQLVGYGQSGTGDTGFTVTPTFSEKRVGANAADLFVVDDEETGADEIYFFDFDDPDPQNSGFFGGPTLGNDVETSVGGGDSGAPAFVDLDGQKVIAASIRSIGSLPVPQRLPASLVRLAVASSSLRTWIGLPQFAPDAIRANAAPSFTPVRTSLSWKILARTR